MDNNVLEHLLSSYNWWLEISTVGVALGILGEYVAHFVFGKEARRNRLEMAISILCGVLVLGGVVGEWIFGSKLSQVSEQLQGIADTEVAMANTQAEAAHGESATARKEADAFELDISKAKRDSALANERAANAEQETAGLNKVAEEERFARVRIEKQMKPRRVSGKQHDLIMTVLHGWAGTPISIDTLPGGSDTGDFSRDLAGVFQDAQFAVSFSFNTVAMGLRANSGLHLYL